MGIEDLTNQAKDFLKSEQAEGISDKFLDGTAGLARMLTALPRASGSWGSGR